MKLFLLVIFLLLAYLAFPRHIFADDIYEGSDHIEVISDISTPTSKIPQIDAGAAIVMDMKSGRVLYEKNAYSKRAMASTTKIMTAIVAIENGGLNDTVTVSKRAASIWGSTISLKEGDKYTLRELLYGMMLNSGNDAAIAVAEHIGGTVENFCEMMNKKAEELGAKNTCFKSPHGLDMDGHYTTAYELALITKYALSNDTFSKIVGTLSSSIPNISLYNTNELLGAYPGTDGVKTGYTGKAGRCLVASVTRDKWKIISVVLNCQTRNIRAQSSEKILNYAFANFKPYDLLQQGEKVGSVLVYKGRESIVPVEAMNEISIPLTENEISSLEARIDLPSNLKAPVHSNVEVGSISYLVDGKVIAQSTLKTSEDVAGKGVLRYTGEIFSQWGELLRAY